MTFVAIFIIGAVTWFLWSMYDGVVNFPELFWALPWYIKLLCPMMFLGGWDSIDTWGKKND